MKRTFIAIDVSAETKRALSAYVEALRRDFDKARVGWERPEKLHLTLRFLGDINEITLEKVRQVLEEVAAGTKQFRMTVVGTGRFPSNGDPRVLWLGIKDDGSVRTLVDRIERSLERSGIGTERKKFNPHLTVARLREPARSHSLSRRHTEATFGPFDQPVNEIVLYESKLLPTGSVYQKLATFPLKGGGDRQPPTG